MNKFESKYFNTAKKMGEALVSLLQEKSYDFITVKDICSKAKVSRSTFYLHYLDMNDLLEEVIKEMNNSFRDSFRESLSVENILNSNKKEELYLITDDYLIPYLEFIKKNKNIYRAIQKNPELFYADKSYKEMFKKIFSPILTKFGVSKDEHKYIMEYYIKGLGAIIVSWVFNDCKEDIEKICSIIKKCIKDY